MSRLRYTIGRGLDIGSLGAYNLSARTGVIAAALAANAELFQFRNSHATIKAVITRVTVSAGVSTTYFAAGVPLTLELKKASAWTVAGSGGTGVTLSTDNRALASMASSAMAAGDIRVATTAGLTAGTKTLETNAISQISAGAPITASLSGQIFPPNTPLYEADFAHGGWPLVLGNNEGFVIRGVQTPGTGTWEAVVNVEWAEMTAYPY